MKYILEVTGKDEEKLISHLATELDIFKTQKVLDIEYKFNIDKAEVKKMKKEQKIEQKYKKQLEKKGFFRKIFRRTK